LRYMMMLNNSKTIIFILKADKIISKNTNINYKYDANMLNLP